MALNRQLALKIDCLEIHTVGCTDLGSSLPFKIRPRTEHAIEVEFHAGEAKGTIMLSGDDVPIAELAALYDAINLRVLGKMTTAAPIATPVPPAFTEAIGMDIGGGDPPKDYEAGSWENPYDGGDDASASGTADE